MIRSKFTIVFLITLLPLAAFAARDGDKSLGWPGETLDGTPCWGEQQGYGPFDYTKSTKNRLHLVEKHHFTPNVEQLIRGENSKDPSKDLDYTLRVFPNHHRALWSVSRYTLRKQKTGTLQRRPRTGQAPPPAECYFNRAMWFAPEDAMVQVVFGVYLHRRGELEAALRAYRGAEKKLPKHAELAYNIGLLYVDMNELDEARKYAQRARDLGYPLPGLQNKIKRKESQTASQPRAE